MIELPFPPATLSGHNTRRRFTEDELARLRSDYRGAVEAGGLAALAASMGRSRSVICEKAKSLGLTDPQAARKRAAQAAKNKCTGVSKWDNKAHPKGFAGKSHGDEAKAKSRAASNKFWGSLNPKQHHQRVTDNLKAAIAKNGRIGPIVNTRATTWKAGWREIGGYRKYYRSRWEANYARYLQWLKERGEIADWQHEPETFWFEGIKRGVRSYLPDFRVTENNGRRPLHEVKGWMDARSKTTLKRMAKYHPNEMVIVVREKEYKAIARTVGPMIGGWE